MRFAHVSALHVTPSRLLRAGVATVALAAGVVISAPMAGASGAPIFFVEANGVGTDCTQAAPCNSITQALIDAQSHGGVAVIEVGSGTFNEDVVIPSGRYSIAGIPGRTVLQPTNLGFSNQGAGSSSIVTISGITIDGATFGAFGAENFGTMNFDNIVVNGTGFANLNGSMTITGSTISSGTSNSGIYNVGTLNVDSSTVTNSQWGIYNDSGATATITNSTLSDNTVDGVFSVGNSVSISASTLSDNANYDLEAGTGSVSIFGSIVNNSFGGTCSAPVTSDGGYNLESSNACGFQSFYGDLVNTDPNLGVLQDNGGQTFTQAILPNSAAHNLVPQASCLATDQRGETRPSGPGSSFCDAGAYQWAAPVSAAIVTNPLYGVTSFSPNLGPVTVQMYDAQGFPAVSAHSVILNLSSGSPNGFFSVANGGSPTSSVIIPAGETSGDFFVGSVTPTNMALVVSIAKLGVLTQTETIVHGPPFYAYITGGDNQSAIVGQSLPLPLAARITDAQGNTFAGSDVTFSVTSGSATFAGGSTSVDVLTDTNGYVTSPSVIVGHQPSDIIITVSDGAASNTFNETGLTGPPAAISITAGNNQATTPTSTFGTDIDAQVVDLYGNPVSAANVDFSVTSGSATLSSTTASTDSNGDATVTLTAGTKSGPVSVSATVDGTSIATTTTGLVVNPDVPATITVTSGDAQTTKAGTNFTNTLSATVTDQYGNPTPGITVNFDASSGGSTFDVSGQPSSDSAVTDAQGVATSHMVLADTKAGPASVSATVLGTSITTAFNETIVPGPAALITVTSGNYQKTQSDHAFPNALTTTVTDQYGNVISGANVLFHIVSGSSRFNHLSNENVVTVSGIAIATGFAAGDHAGVQAISASVVGTSLKVSFVGVVVTPPAYSVRISPFAIGSSALTTALKQQIAGMEAQIAKYGNTKVILSGYADATGADQKNQQLSLQRANAVAGYLHLLLTNGHVSGVAISTVGKGATNFINGNPTLPANRRVDAAIS